MGMTVNVIVTLPDYYEDNTLEEIHDDLISRRLFNDLGNYYQYYTLWDEEAAENSFFGKDQPDKLINYAKNWENNLQKETLDLLKTFFKESHNNPEQAMDFLLYGDDSCFLYRLTHALNKLDDNPTHGSELIFYDKDSIHTRLTENVMKNICHHPEDYAFIEVIGH